MKTPAELRAEANALEKQAKLVEQRRQLEEHNQYVGRAFIVNPTSRIKNSIWTCAILVHKVALDRFGNGYDWTISSIHYSANGQNKTVEYKNKSIAYGFNPHSLIQATEIPIESFKQAKALAQVRAESFRTIIDSLHTNPPPTIDSINDDYEPSEFEFDFPHVLLDSSDLTLVPKDFVLPSNVYILSKKSIAAAIRSLRKEQQFLDRGSHLYQACDMPYVNARTERINRLLNLFQQRQHLNN